MNDKEKVAHHVAHKVEAGMVIGLGTGSTANLFIEELARRNKAEKLDISVVSSSVVSALKAQQLGLPLQGFEHVRHIDIYVDGADEVDPQLTLLKGRGADLVREKLLAKACDQFWVLIDSSKWVGRIGERFAIPIEVMPFAWQMVKNNLESLGGRGELRPKAGNDGLAVTSYGSLVLDMEFEPALNISELDQMLNSTPGVIEHGIFIKLAKAVFCAENGQVEERWA